MKLTVANTKGKKVKVYDFTGAEIEWVTKFDTKTYDIEFVLIGRRYTNPENTVYNETCVRSKLKGSGFNAKVVKVKTTIKGAYAVVNGKRIK